MLPPSTMGRSSTTSPSSIVVTVNHNSTNVNNNNNKKPTTGNKHGAIGTPPRNNNTNNNNNKKDTMVVALRWLTAIQEATRCLRDRPVHLDQGAATIQHALDYLLKLEAILTPLEAQWDQGPSQDPPAFVPYKAKKKKKKKQSTTVVAKKGRNTNNNNNNNNKMVQQSPTSIADQPWTTVSNNNNNKNTFGNRFALFEDSDDDEEEEEECQLFNQRDDDDDKSDVITGRTLLSSCSSSSSDDDLQEAGDVPTLNRVVHFPTHTMGMRRLMIRIVTAQSELLAFLAAGYRRCVQWSQAATNCHASLVKIHQGLLLADGEISRCLAKAGASSTRECAALQEDAAIVEVAVKSLTCERDSFVQKALQHKHQLIRKLEAMYIGRYKARERLGDDWYKSKKLNNNARNKKAGSSANANFVPQATHHSKLRAEKEDELVEIQMALDNLVQWDTQTLVASAGLLTLRLNSSQGHLPVVAPPRNNQTRPLDISDRVDKVLYPDPTLFGWTFTGSHTQDGLRIEFFEKQNMLLDWHYATGHVELKWKLLKPKGKRDASVATSFFRSNEPVHSNFFMELIKNPQPWEAATNYTLLNSKNYA